MNQQYCNCGIPSIMTVDDGDGFGYWEVCGKCGRPIENGYYYYNHFDGEDEDILDIRNLM